MVFDNLGQEFRAPDRMESLCVDESEGDGTVGAYLPILVENGLPDDLTPYTEPFRTSREGSLTVYLRPGKGQKNARLYVYTDSGLTADLEL